MKYKLLIIGLFCLLAGFREPEERKYLGRKVEDIMLVDGAGRQFPLSSLYRNKPLVLNPVYTRCASVCSITSRGIKNTLQQLAPFREQFILVTFSFDSTDTQRDLERYAARWGMDGRQWLMVTAARKEEIGRLLASLDYDTDYNATSGEYEHPNVSVVLTPSGRISRYIYGSQPKAKDLKLAVMEAKAEKTAPGLLAGLYLKCFAFDPVTKTYQLDWGFIISTSAGLLMITIVVTLIFKSFILK